jgi:xanthine dehydrogenase accessory factor
MVRDILAELRRWHEAGTPVGLATVVGVQQSAPRQPGASMALAADGTVMGSVSGGCVEGAVVEVAEQVLADGVPQLARYGFSDDEAFAVGLTCGGQIDIFVERLDPASMPHLPTIADAVAESRPVAVATVLAAPQEPGPAHGVRPGAKLIVWPESVDGTLGNEGIDAAVTDDARGFLEQGVTGQRHYGARGERRLEDVTVFVEALAPRPRMLVFGAIDFASAVARIGVLLGYHVTVCDARAVFATPRRFPQAHGVVVEWPHRYLARTRVDARTVICVLTHDPKFDVPLLEVALRTDAVYIGAMGSRRTHEDRLARLRERGLTEEELARLRSPIGLDLGGRTPEETAVSIAAEIIAERWGGTGRPLSQTEGQIHRPGQALVSP